MKIPHNYLKHQKDTIPNRLKNFTSSGPFFSLPLPFVSSSHMEKEKLKPNEFIILKDSLIEILGNLQEDTMDLDYKYITSPEIFKALPDKHRNLFYYYQLKTINPTPIKKCIIYLSFDKSCLSFEYYYKKLKEISTNFSNCEFYIYLHENLNIENKSEECGRTRILNFLINNFTKLSFIDSQFLESIDSLSDFHLITLKNSISETFSYIEYLCLDKDCEVYTPKSRIKKTVDFYNNLEFGICQESISSKNYLENEYFLREFKKLVKKRDFLSIHHLIQKI